MLQVNHLASSPKFSQTPKHAENEDLALQGQSSNIPCPRFQQVGEFSAKFEWIPPFLTLFMASSMWNAAFLHLHQNSLKRLNSLKIMTWLQWAHPRTCHVAIFSKFKSFQLSWNACRQLPLLDNVQGFLTMSSKLCRKRKEEKASCDWLSAAFLKTLQNHFLLEVFSDTDRS